MILKFRQLKIKQFIAVPKSTREHTREDIVNTYKKKDTDYRLS